MKIKLLKEVRKNYYIKHYPKGYKTASGKYYLKNAYILFFKNEILKADFNKKKLIDVLVKHVKENNNIQGTLCL